MTTFRLALAGLSGLLLAACNTTDGPAPVAYQPAPQPAAAYSGTPQYVTPSGFQMPQGTGCHGEIARFRAVMDNDVQIGHVTQPVYQRVVSELGSAQNACSSGNEGAAMAQLRAVKSRHGYP